MADEFAGCGRLELIGMLIECRAQRDRLVQSLAGLELDQPELDAEIEALSRAIDRFLRMGKRFGGLAGLPELPDDPVCAATVLLNAATDRFEAHADQQPRKDLH